MKIGEKIRSIRKDRRITMVELADKSGLSKTTIGDTETGKTNPGTDTIMKICDGLDISVVELCKGTNYYAFVFDEETHLHPATKYELISDITNSSEIKEDGDSYNTNYKFDDPLKAVEFILSQPSVGDYGNFNVNKLSDEDKINFANDLLGMIKLIGHKYKR